MKIVSQSTLKPKPENVFITEEQSSSDEDNILGFEHEKSLN